MSCTSCKKQTSKAPQSTSQTTGNNYVGKVLVFLIAAIIITPFIIPILWWVLFRVLVLGKGVDIAPLLRHIGKRIFKEEEEPDTDNEDLTEDEYELENPHDVVVIK